ncbi:MAG TPA: glycosyltransferase [Flavipsychrobacter sp.]|nr:glycosyltransferase [Flavipsychrobacter sp.]
MSKIKFHIVSFDIPYPADYGGAIDVFYKIKSLSEAGCEIYLHCFEYGRERTERLNNLCKEVWYYPRKTGWNGLSFSYPYIVYSRRDDTLLQRLSNVDVPILFEGIHCSFYANHPALKRRTKILRVHNIEHDYYKQLAQKERSNFSKIYLYAEAFLLKNYEKSLSNIDAAFCLSHADTLNFQKLYPKKTVAHIAPFHPFTSSDIPTGMGQYCLYHGNLKHPENEEAALFLLEQVIPAISDTQFIIAGRNPSKTIKALCAKYQHCKLIENPDEAEMNRLISNAQINVLPTFQRSGMKLKLLYALYNGRHVVVNDDMLYGTGLASVCNIANTATEIIEEISRLIKTDFTDGMRELRAYLLEASYNNSTNAQRIITFLQQKSL